MWLKKVWISAIFSQIFWNYNKMKENGRQICDDQIATFKQSHILLYQGLLFLTRSTCMIVDARSHTCKTHDFIPRYDIKVHTSVYAWKIIILIVYLCGLIKKMNPQDSVLHFYPNFEHVYRQKNFSAYNKKSRRPRKNTGDPDFHHGWPVGRPRISVFVQHCTVIICEFKLELQSGNG